VRYASTGALEERNTHPFEMKGWLFAHNGVIGDLPALERRLGDARALVHGDTDSERFFALITREIAAAHGDVGAGIARAVRWVADELPVYALNFVLTTADGLWALRYPATHGLHLLERPAGGSGGGRHLEHASAAGAIRVRAPTLAAHPAVVVASERMDEEPAWRTLQPGELVHVGPDLRVRSEVVRDRPPRRLLTLRDLDPRAAASQAAGPAATTPPPDPRARAGA
jgi:glutamine amidotransferase